MRSSLSLVLALALVTPPGLAHAAGWTAEQRATLDRIIALENAGDLAAAVNLAAQEFAQETAPPGYRRAVAKRGRVAAEALFGRTKDVAYLCAAVELMRVYQAELIESAQDREDIPLELARLEAQATAVAAPCAQSPAPPPPPDPPLMVARPNQEGPDLPPAPAPARRSRARIAVSAGLFAGSAGLVAGFAGCYVARELETDRIAVLDEQATAAGRAALRHRRLGERVVRRRT